MAVVDTWIGCRLATTALRWRTSGAEKILPVRALAVATMLMVVCEPHRPDFLTREREDCAADD